MLASAIRKMARRETGRNVALAVAEVTEVDRAGQRVRCRIAATGHKSNWCKVGRPVAENGAGFVADIKPGTEVLVAFPGGNPAEPGVVLASLYGRNGAPECGQGELVLAHPSGTKITVGGDGKVTVAGAGEVAIDGTVVKVGGGAASGVRYEQLEAFLGAWITACQSAGVPLVPVNVPPFSTMLATAKAQKVRVT